MLDASALASAHARDSQRLVKQLVRQSATLIENGYFLKSYSHCCILLAYRNRHFVEVQPEMLVAVDEHGSIVAANRCARLAIEGLATLPRPVAEVFDVRPERLFDARAGHSLLPLHLAACARARPDPPHAAENQRASDSYSAQELAERTRILNAMTAAKWRPLPAAAILGMSRATLYRRMKQLHIVPPHRQ